MVVLFPFSVLDSFCGNRCWFIYFSIAEIYGTIIGIHFLHSSHIDLLLLINNHEIVKKWPLNSPKFYP